MAHKTLIDGTAYEISGGKTLIDGTVFAIDKGKTLVDGTAYEVGFAPDGATVTITKTKAGFENISAGGYVTIDGVDYKEPTNIVVPLGTVIVCKAPWASTQYGAFGGEIKLNGTVVAFRGSATPVTYDYTVNKDVQIHIQNVGAPSGVQANISITEL